MRCSPARPVLFALLLGTGPAASPATGPADAALAAEMRAVDAVAGRVETITADFRQEKFTPLLKRPLVSTGRVVARGGVALWTTVAPQPTVMRVTADEIRLYYPNQKLLEIYPVQGQVGALAAGPLPRLADLERFFTFARVPAATLDPAATDAARLGLELTPSTDDLRQHVRSVRVLLDRSTGAIRRAETTDADGDRTVLTFADVQPGADVPDAAVVLEVPAGTRESRPLAADGGR